MWPTIQKPNTILNPNAIDHSKSEHIWYSSPHCAVGIQKAGHQKAWNIQTLHILKFGFQIVLISKGQSISTKTYSKIRPLEIKTFLYGFGMV